MPSFPANPLPVHAYSVHFIHITLLSVTEITISLSLSLIRTMASLHLPLSLLLLLLPTISASPSPLPTTTADCSAELVAFSPCLPFVASYPSNISSSPSPDCCTVFSSALNAPRATASCLCYPVRSAAFFGFPLNNTKLFSLSFLCPPADGADGSNVDGSLQSLCSGLLALPPLHAIRGPEIPRTHDSGLDSSSPPVKSSIMPDSDGMPRSDGVSDATPSPSTPTHFHAALSSASKQPNNHGYWSPLGTIVFLVPIFTNICCHTTHC